VLRTACEQNVAWQCEGLPRLVVSVNLSPRQFFDEHLLDEIQDALACSGLAPQWLELEITESLLMQDVERALQVLAGLKDIGVRIAIDDFGVGYSSLATLERFPIDTVKIDRSFIRDVDHVTAGATLTSAVIAMGKSLSLTVVAQGVETREQADYLHAHACDEFQGFYFDKPLPAGQFAGLLQAQQHTEADP
jgi:EAL domain-containing protein (putative c-di-GMP-specific phosphodiesterase class I)